MAIGPVDVYVIGFPGNKFSGQIVPAIMEQVQAGVIRVLDVLFVMKDAEGTVVTLSIEDLDADGAAFAELDITSPGALNDEDADEIADDLPLDSSALHPKYRNLRHLSHSIFPRPHPTPPHIHNHLHTEWTTHERLMCKA